MKTKHLSFIITILLSSASLSSCWVGEALLDGGFDLLTESGSDQSQKKREAKQIEKEKKKQEKEKKRKEKRQKWAQEQNMTLMVDSVTNQ